MKILALIPARGGSKRLPDKNRKILGGKPLINWTINLAKEIPEVCEILVSTDDEKIAAIAKSAGANVPWLRPAEISNDKASSVSVALHALNWYEKKYGAVDALLLLQPTSPFRNIQSMARGIELFKKQKDYPVIGVSLVREHPEWVLQLENGLVSPLIKGNGMQTRSQDLNTLYIPNGSFYLISPTILRKLNSFIGYQATPLIIESIVESIDIDTQEDFDMAEFYLKSIKLKSSLL